MRRRLLLALACYVLGTAGIAAQTPPTRVRGEVEQLSGNVLKVRTREGPSVDITMAPNFAVIGVTKAELSSIASNSFVGVAAVPQPDGMLRALEVLVFPESARGSGEGHYPWDLTPESTMTNATVAELASQPSGRVMTLRYKDGEKKVVVPEGIPIVTFASADASMLKSGAHVFLSTTRQPDGALAAARVLVGKDGLVPPM